MEASAACADRHASAQAVAQDTGHEQEAGAAAAEAAGGSDLKLSPPSGTGAGLGGAQPGAIQPSGPSSGQQQQQSAPAGLMAAGTGAVSTCSLADAQQAEQQQHAGAQQCSSGAALQEGGPQGSAAIPDASSAGSSASTARSLGSASSHSRPAASDDLQLSPEVKHMPSMHDPCNMLQHTLAVSVHLKHLQGTKCLRGASAGLCSPDAAIQAGVHRPCQGGCDPGGAGRRRDALPVQCSRECPAGQVGPTPDTRCSLWSWTPACTQPSNVFTGRSGNAWCVGINGLPCGWVSSPYKAMDILRHGRAKSPPWWLISPACMALLSLCLLTAGCCVACRSRNKDRRFQGTSARWLGTMAWLSSGRRAAAVQGWAVQKLPRGRTCWHVRAPCVCRTFEPSCCLHVVLCRCSCLSGAFAAFQRPTSGLYSDMHVIPCPCRVYEPGFHPVRAGSAASCPSRVHTPIPHPSASFQGPT